VVELHHTFRPNVAFSDMGLFYAALVEAGGEGLACGR
jgi:hypothetical protein